MCGAYSKMQSSCVWTSYLAVDMICWQLHICNLLKCISEFWIILLYDYSYIHKPIFCSSYFCAIYENIQTWCFLCCYLCIHFFFHNFKLFCAGIIIIRRQNNPVGKSLPNWWHQLRLVLCWSLIFVFLMTCSLLCLS